VLTAFSYMTEEKEKVSSRLTKNLFSKKLINWSIVEDFEKTPIFMSRTYIICKHTMKFRSFSKSSVV
jgi:hypothetical protein